MTNGANLQDIGTTILGDEEIQTLMRAGVHIGHVRSKTHPAMRPFIFGTRNNIEIIDVLKTAEYLAKAEAFLQSVTARGGMVLWVGTKPSARHAVEAAARETGMPYVANRWVGGLLTNFRVISKRAAEMEEIEKAKASGGLDKYTKHERAKIDREHDSLMKAYDGIRVMKRLPEAIIIIETVHDHLSLREARRMKIPLVALADTNTDPRQIQYPVPANDDAKLSVEYMISRFAVALMEGKKEAERTSALAAAQAQAAAETSSVKEES